MRTKNKSIKCTCGSNEFSITLNKVESVGIVTCKKCEKNYFLLDSGDYWYDIIQEKYPSKVKCSKCKNDSFDIELTYEFREDSNDVKYIEIVSICKKCLSSKRLGTWEIDYSPTDSLIQQPIIFCKNPKIKYGLSTNTCYWTPQDLAKFLNFVYELNLSIYCQYFENRKILTRKIKREEVVKRSSNLDFYNFIVSKKELTVTKDQKINWKKEEVISISSPINMNLSRKTGLLFYIQYSTNYIEDFKSGKIKEKSQAFKETTKKIEEWLKSNYESLRGKNSFDNFKEHKRLFGNKFLKKKR